jgi:hypothetical protein
MKFVSPWTLAAVPVAAVLATALGLAQTPPAAQSPVQPATPAGVTPRGGQVIFSRSSDENGDTTTQAGPAAQATSEPMASDADRRAVAVTAMDLDVRLQPAAQHIAVRAQLTVRNDSRSPLVRIPLQISSSLRWEQIRLGGRTVAFPVATLISDADHTGQLHEAAVPLAVPLAPGATVQIDTTYSGTIAPTAQRLVTIGTPEALALHSDWDEISPAFTGLRGFGNVVWYPVSSVPAILGDGARLFDEIGRHKLRLVGCTFALRLTAEFPQGQPPAVALVNGVSVPLTVADTHGLDPDLTGVATAASAPVMLGFEAPSLFVARRTAHPGPAPAGTVPNVTAWTTVDNEVAVRFWLDAASAVTPFVQRWLGARPRTPLTLLDLPDPDDAPYEAGALLVAGLKEAPADRLGTVLAHALARAYVPAAPAWLSEGQATFVESLWLEKQRGRDQALGMLEADRSALALAEPSSPGENPGTPLAQAIAPVYYRTKAAYVLWMLRDAAGDDALSAALSACDAAAPANCNLLQLLQKTGAAGDPSWLFSDWVDADKGLPDLTVDGVFPTSAQSGTYLVAVNVSNAGYASAAVPITVRTANSTVTERLLVPARGRAVQRILSVGPPTEVQVNDGTVPETGASVHVTPVAPPPPAPPSTGPTPHKQPRDKNAQ